MIKPQICLFQKWKRLFWDVSIFSNEFIKKGFLWQTRKLTLQKGIVTDFAKSIIFLSCDIIFTTSSRNHSMGEITWKILMIFFWLYNLSNNYLCVGVLQLALGSIIFVCKTTYHQRLSFLEASNTQYLS